MCNSHDAKYCTVMKECPCSPNRGECFFKCLWVHPWKNTHLCSYNTYSKTLEGGLAWPTFVYIAVKHLFSSYYGVSLLARWQVKTTLWIARASHLLQQEDVMSEMILLEFITYWTDNYFQWTTPEQSHQPLTHVLVICNTMNSSDMQTICLNSISRSLVLELWHLIWRRKV